MSASPFAHPHHRLPLPTGGGPRLFLAAAAVALAAVAGVVAALVAGMVQTGSATTTTVIQSAPATADFVLDGRGDLVTAAHVVDGATVSAREALADGARARR